MGAENASGAHTDVTPAMVTKNKSTRNQRIVSLKPVGSKQPA
jgi:hypothetical protein